MKNTNTETKTTKATTNTSPNKKESTAQKAVATPPTVPMNPPSVFDDKAFCNDIKKRCDNIVRELTKTSESFIRIGVELAYIRDKEGFKVMGAKDIYDLAKTKFGIARGTASDFIGVAESFCKRDDSGNLIPELQDSYKGFSSSKLMVMQGMTNETLLEVKPDMTVREIKKLKKGEESEPDTAETDTAETGEESEIKIKEIPTPQRNVMITVSSIEEYDAKEDEIYNMIRRALAVKKGESPKYKVEISYIW